MGRLLAFTLLLAAGAGSGTCAARGLQLPSGEGEAFPEYQRAFDEASRGCRDVRSLSAELTISGRAGGEKLRGRVLAGLAAPGRLRLEAVAPFGPPVFILAASGTSATLLLPRDNRVLTGEPASAILGALVGLELGPDDLLAILSGCVVPSPEPSAGRRYTGGWVRVDLAGGAAAFLGQEGQRWRIRSGVRPGLAIEYEPAGDGGLSRVRLQVPANDGTPASDVRLGLSQVETNPQLGPEVFAVKVPRDATSMTLAEVRSAGPVGEKR
jgi:outer membrane lipoprotein-sorting protein